MPPSTVTKPTLREAYGDYLQGYPWTHFCILTFREPASVAGVWREFHRWIDRLTEEDEDGKTKGTIWWFAAVERGLDGQRHVHALIEARPKQRCRSIREEWVAGYASIQKYDPNRPGVHYATKSLEDSDTAEYDFNLPKLR